MYQILQIQMQAKRHNKSQHVRPFGPGPRYARPVCEALEGASIWALIWAGASPGLLGFGGSSWCGSGGDK